MDRLDPATTALLLVDLQQGILQLPVVPHTPSHILDRAAGLIRRFHNVKAPVIFTRVAWSPDFRDALQPPVDRPLQGPTPGPDWANFPDRLGVGPTDLVITKRQWGAFHGTELDLQLRRRGIQTIALAGIATNLGVESTARAAWEHGYHIVFLEDMTASLSPEMHSFAFNAIFPLIGRVRSAADVSSAIGTA